MEEGMLVRKIRNGTVIDHVPAGRALLVLRLLGITGKEGYTVAVVINVESRKLGRKDIVKIEDRYLDPGEADKIALIAPTATINIIRDYKVVEKRKVEAPKTLTGILECINPTCITRKPREPVVPKFRRVPGEKLRYQCIYCGTIIEEEEILRQLTGTQ